MEFTIRKAEERDIPGIVKLLYQVQDVHAQKRPDIFKLGARKYTNEQLSKIIDTTPVFVAEENGTGRILGHAFCVLYLHMDNNSPKYSNLYIDDLCVDETARGGHIGKALFDHVISYARREGCYNVTLNVWSCNENAMGFYKAMGMDVQKIGMEKIL